MANSVISLSALPGAPACSIDSRTVTYYFQARFGAGSYVLGGLPINFASAVIANGAPIEVRAFSNASPPSVYTYQFNSNQADASAPSIATGGLQIFGSGGTEQVAGATPAGVVADTITVIAKFAR
jgi:hypothetical protein